MIPAAWSTKIANTHSNQAGKFYEEYTPALAENSPAPAVAGLYAADPDGISRPLVARESGYRMDLETENFVVASTLNGSEVDDQAAPLVGGDGPHGRSTLNGMDTVVAATLSGGGHPGSNLPGRHKEDDENLVVANAVRASDGHHGHSSPRGDGADNLVAWDALDDTHHTLRGAGLQRSDGVAMGAGVRRLTPLECERLMGWPDEWTKYGADGKELPDSHRYRLCGNGVVATVAEWIGHRLVEADAWP